MNYERKRYKRRYEWHKIWNFARWRGAEKDQLKRLQAYVEAIQKKCRVIRIKLSRNWWQRDIDRVWHRVISRIVQGWKRLILPDWRMAREFLHWWFWKICQCIRETYWSKNTVKESKHKMKLYHGTNYSSAINIVNHGIDLKYSKPYLDFGPGFYTTPSYDHAALAAIRTTQKYNAKIIKTRNHTL